MDKKRSYYIIEWWGELGHDQWLEVFENFLKIRKTFHPDYGVEKAFLRTIFTLIKLQAKLKPLEELPLRNQLYLTDLDTEFGDDFPKNFNLEKVFNISV